MKGMPLSKVSFTSSGDPLPEPTDYNITTLISFFLARMFILSGQQFLAEIDGWNAVINHPSFLSTGVKIWTTLKSKFRPHMYQILDLTCVKKFGLHLSEKLEVT